MFITRLISGIVLLAVTIGLVCAGGIPLLLMCLFVGGVGLFELYRVMKIEKTSLALVGYGATFLWYLNLLLQNRGLVEIPSLFIVTLMILAVLAVFVFRYPKHKAEELFLSVFGFLYVPVMISFIYRTRVEVNFGQYLVWMTYISAWGCDTCAYCVGRLLGKHKLAPILSPKKSIEGSIGGIVGAALLGLLYSGIMCMILHEPTDIIPVCGLVGAVGGAVSQIGDLAASGIKRTYGVKDYGNLIPGHGGIMDRFDSIIITAPIVYYLSVWLMHAKPMMH